MKAVSAGVAFQFAAEVPSELGWSKSREEYRRSNGLERQKANTRP